MKLEYLHLASGGVLPQMRVRPHRAVLIAEQATADGWRNEVSSWLVDAGCLYFIAWGVDCEAWHDCVDWAVLEDFDYRDIPDDRFVMTTWHDKDPLSEALWFAGQCARHPDVDLDETVLVHVAPDARRVEMIDCFLDSQATPDDSDVSVS